MTQEQWLILAFKIVTISGFCSIVQWIGLYTRFAPWWHNPVGRSLVIKSSLLALLLVPTILALFFQFDRFTSDVAGWVDVAILGLITPVMLWRSRVWWRLRSLGALPSDLARRVAELEAENARLKGEGSR